MTMITLPPSKRASFRRKIYVFFRRHRRRFSWRATRDPYRILVSEIMLQQTQVDRVERKFREFVKAFPDFRALARAPLSEVLRVWQGMGYNRRALYLHRAAREVQARYEGKLPGTVEQLEELPGIGPATARSIAAYAFDLPTVFIETNIRAVFIHEFFKDRSSVPDKDILPLVEQTCDRRDPWKWYNALMDYGAMIKARHGNPARKSRHYAKQSPFKSSDRRIRGIILGRASRRGRVSLREFQSERICDTGKLRRCFASLVADGLLEKKGKTYQIAGD